MKKNILIFAILLIGIMATSGCFEEPVGEIVYTEYIPPPTPKITFTPQPGNGGGPDIGAGQSTFESNCSGCHGMTATGMLPGTPDFSDAGYWSSKTDEEIISTIKSGIEGTPMPAWEETLSDDDITNVIAYLQSLAGIAPSTDTGSSGGTEISAGSAEGETTFKTNCSGCHGLDGTGMLPGTPDFSDAGYWSSKTDEEIISTIKSGREGTPMPPWEETLSDDEIIEVIKHLKSLQG